MATVLPIAPALQASGWGGLVPWLLVLGLLLLGAGVVLAWSLLQRQADLVAVVRRQASELAELRSLTASWIGTRESLDLRRIEHVLVDIRDGQQRVEDALLRTVERERRTESAAPDVDGLLERIVNRLLASGYERVQVLIEREELDLTSDERREVPLEARRDGVQYKGRALVQSGRVVDIDMRPPYALFP